MTSLHAPPEAPPAGPTRRAVARGALAAAGLAAASLTSACSRPVVADQAAARQSRGPITVWTSNNEQELAWGKTVTDAWNVDHPDEKVTLQEVPAGASTEEAITAAIVAGTTPDLLFAVSPAATSDWVRQGGLVDLSSFDGGSEYIEDRVGEVARGYVHEDGRYYQMPWKSNPVMIMYNRKLFKAAGLDPDDPGMTSYETFLDGAQRIVDAGASRSAIWPAPTAEYFQSWFDYYPLLLAQTHGTRLIEDGSATFAGPEGMAVGEFWAQIYERGLAPQETSTDNAMAVGTTAMQIAGPWAIASYDGTIDYGIMPVPTQEGVPPEQITTFADAKNASIFTSSRNQRTAWDVLRFATDVDQDRTLLDLTGQLPMRTHLLEVHPQFFEENPVYRAFAEQSDRVADVPNISGAIEIWQRFRDAYVASVILGKRGVSEEFPSVARDIDTLLGARS
ncbi:extracellular solute-binding protein [Brachybacterium sacelli]|uniref:Multiple sugar transport system substrate-binding protein n=1 Tax=Brachybacterium sacelli TaxID=173364 RepID=A0ABS4WZ17_9MICO|nr:extracellular solute-binding protein [Brachybacterium sacelli]MBP2381445.1 multiple sugar transport system substrate-binding protein [Brachybacterium sacelli]